MVLITLSEFWASNLTFWAATYARQSRQSVCLYYFWKPSMDMIWSSSSAAPSQHTIITTEWLFGTHPKFTQVGKTKSKQKNEIDTVVVKEEDKIKASITVSGDGAGTDQRDYTHQLEWTVAYLHRPFRSMQQFAFIVMRQLISIKSFIVQCSLTQVKCSKEVQRATQLEIAPSDSYHHLQGNQCGAVKVMIGVHSANNEQRAKYIIGLF